MVSYPRKYSMWLSKSLNVVPAKERPQVTHKYGVVPPVADRWIWCEHGILWMAWILKSDFNVLSGNHTGYLSGNHVHMSVKCNESWKAQMKTLHVPTTLTGNNEMTTSSHKNFSLAAYLLWGESASDRWSFLFGYPEQTFEQIDVIRDALTTL